MGMFGDFMTMVDMGEKLARGDVEGVKRDLLRDTPPAAAGRQAAEAAPCTKAPPGYKCLGTHDELGRCMTLEAIP